jgi:hypothetical protein
VPGIPNPSATCRNIHEHPLLLPRRPKNDARAAAVAFQGSECGFIPDFGFANLMQSLGYAWFLNQL